MSHTLCEQLYRTDNQGPRSSSSHSSRVSRERRGDPMTRSFEQVVRTIAQLGDPDDPADPADPAWDQTRGQARIQSNGNGTDIETSNDWRQYYLNRTQMGQHPQAGQDTFWRPTAFSRPHPTVKSVTPLQTAYSILTPMQGKNDTISQSFVNYRLLGTMACVFTPRSNSSIIR